MKSLASICLLLFISLALGSVKAQINPGKQPVSETPRMDKNVSDRSADDISVAGLLRHSTPTGEKGGMYMAPGWIDGMLILHDGTEIDNWQYRYNIRFDQMQYFDGTDTLAFAEPSEIKYLQLQDGKTFIVETFVNEEEIDTGFFELIKEGQNKLLYKHVITHHIADGNEREESNFLHNDVYYVQFGNNPAKPVYLNKRCVLHVFGDDSHAIKEFIKKNHIKCKSREDLIAVFDYYNTL